jgi:hypothetical protein
MFGSRWKKVQYYHPIQHSLTQLFLTCLNHKKYTFFLLLFLFTIPMIYLIADISTESTNLDDNSICSKLINIIYNSNRTLCSADADLRGNKQRIIGLSIFGPKENSFFVDTRFPQLISLFINEAELLFPTWVIRLYSDELTINRLNLNNLSRLSPNIDICNVNQLPVLGNVGEYLSGRLWRFLSALDPMVDFTSSRDLDSPLTKREQVLIEQFIDSSYLFLTIRDHPLHNVPMLAGLWTTAQYRNRLLLLRLFSILLDKNRVQKYSLKNDQTLLEELIWPKVKDRTLVYDSYTCRDFPGGHQCPFPTQRPSSDCHVGCVRPCCQNSSRIILSKPCPEQCRPKNHLDWVYC